MTTRDDDFDISKVHIVDCDAHLTEPPDVWTSRAPKSMLDRMPVQKTVDGVTSWYMDGEIWSGLGGNTLQTGNKKAPGTLYTQPFDLIDRAAYSVKERLELLDKMGIWAQVLYPNGIGFASNHIFAIEDHELRLAVLQIYNDFLVDVQDESDDRLLPQAVLPIWDVALTVKEMNRLLDKGIRGFTLTDKPEMIGLPELPEVDYEPMWDLFNESGAVANFHIASGASRKEREGLLNPRRDGVRSPNGSPAAPAWSYMPMQRLYATTSSQSSMSNMRIIANLCFSDLFDRFEKLKVVSVESGIGWIPFLLEQMEFLYDEMVVSEESRGFAKRRPTEYFHDHIYAMFWFESVAAQRLLDVIGINNVMVETDVPHPASLYPGPREHFERVLADQEPHVIERVLRDNGAELYKVDLSKAPPL